MYLMSFMLIIHPELKIEVWQLEEAFTLLEDKFW